MSKLAFPTEKTPIVMGQKYLDERGIPPESIDKCGLEFASKQTCLDRLQSKRKTNYTAGIIIPYTPDYSTVRWLGDNVSAFGTRLNDDPKLLAPSGPPHTYIPPIIDWTKFSGTIYICESALKAIALAQHGYCAIAGNGVDGIYNHLGFAEDFPHHLFEAEKVTNVQILFDSDWQTNVNVQAAIRRQATGIANTYGSVVIRHKALGHKEDGTPWGIDDAIASQGVGWLHSFLSCESNEVEIEISPLQRHLDELNEGYVVCKKPISIIDQRSSELYNKANFTDILEADRAYKERLDKRLVEIQPAKCWLKWDGRTIVDRLVYTPGQARLTEQEYNSWRDDGVPAVEGGIEPFLKVYRNAIPDTEVRELLIESMAYMLQNRGTKIDKTFLLIGTQISTGKSLLAQTMGKLVGRSNYSSIGVEDFTGDHNSAFTAKEVVLLDDLYQMPKAAMAKLKRYVTDETLMINPKGIKQYEIDNHAVYFMTSNEFMTLPMDNNERRVLTVHFDPVVHYPTGTPWWDDYIVWLDSGGYSYIRYWLEHIDLADFNPNYMPPMTEAKKRIIDSTKSPEAQWVQDLFDNPDDMLSGTKRCCFTPDELWMLYSGGGDEPSRSEKTAFGQAFSNSGFWKANNNKPCRAGGTKPQRYWVIRGDGREWSLRDVQKDVKASPNAYAGG